MRFSLKVAAFTGKGHLRSRSVIKHNSWTTGCHHMNGFRLHLQLATVLRSFTCFPVHTRAPLLVGWLAGCGAISSSAHLRAVRIPCADIYTFFFFTFLQKFWHNIRSHGYTWQIFSPKETARFAMISTSPNTRTNTNTNENVQIQTIRYLHENIQFGLIAPAT